MALPPASQNAQPGSSGKRWQRALSSVSYCSFAGVALLLLPLLRALVVGYEGGGAVYAMMWVHYFLPALAVVLPVATVLGLVSYILGHDRRLFTLSSFGLAFAATWVLAPPNEVMGSMALVAYLTLSFWWWLRWFVVGEKDAADSKRARRFLSWVFAAIGILLLVLVFL